MEWKTHARGTIDVGDVLAVLRHYPDGYFDAVLTDPPYGLSDPPDMAEVLDAWLKGEAYQGARAGFMGKAWDAFVPGPEVWREVYRVMKPGAHIMAFAGSRTHDLMTLAIRLAGFEVRDALMWIYGTGFPKSMAIDKAIERRRGDDIRPVCRFLRAAIDASDHTVKTIAERFGFHPRMVEHWAERDTASQPSVPKWDQWLALKDLLGFGDEMDAEVWRLNGRKGQPGEAYLQRPITGEVEDLFRPWRTSAGAPSTENSGLRRDVAATEQGARWQGYGTTLKPAHEPITLAMKPLAGTFAENALTHGVAGLNIEGGRVGVADAADLAATRSKNPGRTDHVTSDVYGASRPQQRVDDAGRWPPNVLVDEAIAADLGERAKYFYVAKPGRPERDAGLEALADGIRHRVNPGGLEHDPRWAPVVAKNDHATVKPIDLTRQLATLILPPPRGDRPRRLLVPYCGSGSEMIGAALAGWEEIVGIEQDPHFAEIAVRRIDYHVAQAVRLDTAG